MYNELAELLMRFVCEQAKDLLNFHSQTGVEMTNLHVAHLGMIVKNEKITMVELSKVFRIHKSTTTRIVNSLIKWGYVEIDVNAMDNRKRTLTITEKGREAKRELTIARNGAIKQIFSELSSDEIKTLIRLLKKAKTSLPNLPHPKP